MVKALENVVFEFLFVSLLHVEVLSQLLNFICQAFLPHSKIIDNESQVLIDPIKMLQLLSHLVRLLVQFLDFELSRPYVPLHLLYLVIEYEFELLQFLSFLLQFIDSVIFILYGVISFFEFALLGINLLPQICGQLRQFSELLVLFIYFSLQLLFLALCFFVFICDQGEICFRLHPCIYDLGKSFLIFFLSLVNIIPGLVFNILSFFFVLLHHSLDLLL